MKKSAFKFKSQLRVRNYEVDWQGIVHNANYLLYFELGRLEYLKHVGLHLNLNKVRNEVKIVLVKNEINYRSPARYDDLLNIYSRISHIGNTSFIFEGIIEHTISAKIISENVAVHVWLDPVTEKAIKIPDNFRKIIRKYERTHVRIVTLK